MPQFLFDTDHLTLLEHNHPPLVQRLVAHPAKALGISAVTVAEALQGRLAFVARQRSGPLHLQAFAQLLTTVQLLHQFPLVPYDQACEDQYQLLLAARTRVGTNDLKIASVALVNKLTVLTRNSRDFSRIPGVVIADWTV